MAVALLGVIEMWFGRLSVFSPLIDLRIAYERGEHMLETMVAENRAFSNWLTFMAPALGFYRSSQFGQARDYSESFGFSIAGHSPA